MIKSNEVFRKLNGMPLREDAHDYELDLTPRLQPIDWKLGDWCICEMKIAQIVGIDRDTLLPNAISDADIRSWRADFTPSLFPLTLVNKSWAEALYALYRRLDDFTNLNFPDIHRYFCAKCVECLRAAPDQRGPIFAQVRKFTEDVEKLAKNKNSIVIDGVRVFK
jgi:hypothetical protein